MALPLLIPAAAIGGASLLSGLIGGSSQSAAARAQAREMQRILGPFAQAGQAALGDWSTLMGLGDPEEQAAMIAEIAGGPEMQALIEQGENAMLQNAAATGGLRGGNLQGALAKFRPQVLSQLINQRMAQLGGLAGMGQQAATTLGTGLGSAGAAGALARGGMWNALPNALMGGLGLYSGLGGTFGGLGGSASGGVAAGAMNPFMYAGRGGNLVGGRMDASGGW